MCVASVGKGKVQEGEAVCVGMCVKVFMCKCDRACLTVSKWM